MLMYKVLLIVLLEKLTSMLFQLVIIPSTMMFSNQSVIVLVEFINHPTQLMPIWLYGFILSCWSRFVIFIEVVGDSFPENLFTLGITSNAATGNCEPRTCKQFIIINTPWSTFAISFFHWFIGEGNIFELLLSWIWWNSGVRNWICLCCILSIGARINIFSWLTWSWWVLQICDIWEITRRRIHGK